MHFVDTAKIGDHECTFTVLDIDVFIQMNTNKGNNKITELRTILQRESQNS
jgi:hypothetical protein